MTTPDSPSVSPLRRVMVGTDLTVHGRRAALRAGNLPLARQAEILVVHVLPPGLDPRLQSGATRTARAALRQVAEATRRVARRSTPGVKVDLEVRSGRPSEVLAEAAEEHGSELVVVGRHGHRGFKRLLIGSTARRVVHQNPRPVLVVGSAALRPYRRVVVAVDLEEGTCAVLGFSTRVLAQVPEQVTVVHVFERPYLVVLRQLGAPPDRMLAYTEQTRAEATQRLEETLARCAPLPPRMKALLRPGDPRQVILGQVKREDAPLLVVGTHRRSGVPRMLLGSVAEGLVDAAPSDVLVVHGAAGD